MGTYVTYVRTVQYVQYLAFVLSFLRQQSATMVVALQLQDRWRNASPSPLQMDTNNTSENQMLLDVHTHHHQQNGEHIRSIDEYFEQAYRQTTHATHRWKYIVIVLALGMANIGDATEFFSIGYVLSDPTFQEYMLHQDMKVNGALITSSITAGMIVGGLLVRPRPRLHSTECLLLVDYYSLCLVISYLTRSSYQTSNLSSCTCSYRRQVSWNTNTGEDIRYLLVWQQHSYLEYPVPLRQIFFY